MPKEFKRTDRVASTLKRELAVLIHREVKDPRLQLLTISAVTVTRDLSYATVYFSVLNDSPENIEACDTVLKNASKYLRGALGKTLKLRSIPELRFVYDKSVVEGERLSQLIDRLGAESDDNAH